MTDKIAKAVEVYGRVSKEAALFDDGYGELAAVFVASASYRRAEFEYEQCFEHRIPKGSAFEQMMRARKDLDAALQRAAEKVMQ